MMRRTVFVLAMVAMAASACSADEAVHPPRCSGSSSGLLLAQSVPDAAYVPCFAQLPEGWEFGTTHIDQDGGLTKLETNRPGDTKAELHYLAECDVTELTGAGSDHGIERWADRSGDGPTLWVQTFDAGCVRLEIDGDVDAAVARDLSNSLQLYLRSSLEADVRETFIADVDL